MGYTVAVHAKNPRVLREMWSFLKDSYRDVTQVFGYEHSYSRLSVNIGKESETEWLSYDYSRLAIGFDYNSMGPERDYIYSIISWISIQIGKEIRVGNIGKAPYYVYDGSEKTPVFVKSVWGDKIPKEYKSDAVDDIGFMPIAAEFPPGMIEDEKLKQLSFFTDRETEQKIYNELKRLDTEYKKFINK